VNLKQIYLNNLPKLNQLPKSIQNWGRLKVLHVNSCGIKALPDGVSAFTSLSMVSLNNNPLRSLPTVRS
jgi:Leucine-rich repeat (LRR) protein